MIRVRRGAALLEVMVAISILAIAITASLAAVRQALASLERTAAAGREMSEAVAFLDAVSLWETDDLLRRLGNRRQGDWRLVIQRPHPRLFTVVLTDSTGVRELLATSLYRPTEDDS